MPKPICHFCESLNGLIVIPTGDLVCPHCWTKLTSCRPILPLDLKKSLKKVSVINLCDPIDKIIIDLICFFMNNGMTITTVAKQMGITRATIYSKLRNHNLVNPHPIEESTINVSDTDVTTLNLKRRLSSKPSVPDYRSSDRYCPSLALLDIPKLPADLPESPGPPALRTVTQKGV